MSTAGASNTTLYRAVSPQELADILSTGGFRPLPSSLQGKWFAETPEHAAAWGQRFWQQGGGPFHVVCVELPTDLAEQMFQLAHLDRIGPARYADDNLLALLNQNHFGIQEVVGIP